MPQLKTASIGRTLCRKFFQYSSVGLSVTGIFLLNSVSASENLVRVTSHRATVAVNNIQDGLAISRDLRASGEHGRIVIRLPPGVIRLDKAIEIGPEIAGNDQDGLELQGDSDEATIISGAVLVPSATANIRKDNQSVRINIRDEQAKISPRSYDRPQSSYFDLYQGSRTLNLNRWPLHGFTRDLDISQVAGADTYLIKFGAMAGAREIEPNPMISGYWQADWAFTTVPASQDPDELQKFKVTFPPDHRLPFARRPRLAIENLFTNLTIPGTYAVNRAQTFALVVPFDDGEDLEMSRAENLLVINNADNVTINNIVFEKTLSDSIKINKSNNIELANCYVGQSGASGIVVSGGENVRISRCVISNTAELGIQVSGGDRSQLRRANHSIQDDIVTNFARLGRDYKAGVRVEGVGIRVAACKIYNGLAAGIIVSGNENEITGNEIYEVLADSDDAGAIYMGRDWTKRGNRIKYNYIHDVGFHSGKMFIVGIYLDDMASGSEIVGNIVERTRSSIVLGGGRDNIISDNLLIEPESWGVVFDSRGLSERQQHLKDLLIKNYQAVPTAIAEWRNMYPGIDGLLDSEPFYPKGNLIKNNIFLNGRGVTVDRKDLLSQVHLSKYIDIDANYVRKIDECLYSGATCEIDDRDIKEIINNYDESRSHERKKFEYMLDGKVP